MFRLPSSTCPRRVNDQLRNALAGTSSTFVIRQRGAEIEVEEEGSVVAGSIDPDGVVEVVATQVETQGSCVVTVRVELTADISHSPTTATYAARVTTMSCPNPVNCSLRITSRWVSG